MIKTTTVRCLALCTALCLAVLAATRRQPSLSRDPITVVAKQGSGSISGGWGDPGRLKRLVWTDEGQLTPAGFGTALREVDAANSRRRGTSRSPTRISSASSVGPSVCFASWLRAPRHRTTISGQCSSSTRTADAVAFTLQPGRDQLGDAMLVLDSLRRQFGAERLAAYEPHRRHLRSSRPTSIRAGTQPNGLRQSNEIWAYYVRYEDRMALGVKSMPADLLAHVVDTTASVAEMQWAMERYGRDPQVGNRYAEISYDDNAAPTRPEQTHRRRAVHPQNIRRVGGGARSRPTSRPMSARRWESPPWRSRRSARPWPTHGSDSSAFAAARPYGTSKAVAMTSTEICRLVPGSAGRTRTTRGHVAILSQIVGTTPEQIQVAVAMHDAAAALAESKKFRRPDDCPGSMSNRAWPRSG